MVGKLDTRLVLAAIQKLAGEGRKPVSLLMVLAELGAETDERLVNLVAHLRDTLRKEALRLYEKRKHQESISDNDSALLGGLSFEPSLEWKWPGDPTPATESVLRTTREIALLAGSEQKAPQLFREIKHRLSQNLAAAQATIAPRIAQLWSLLKELDEAWPATLPGRVEALSEIRRQRRAVWDDLLRKATQSLTDLPEAAQKEPDETMLLAALREKFATAENRDQRAQILDVV